MSYNLDQTTDYAVSELHTFLDGISTPDFVKQAEMDTHETVEKLAVEAFADRYNRAYPIHTPASTYVSNVHFFQKRAELTKKWGVGYTEEVASRLKTAGQLHKIAADMADFEQQTLVKAAAAPEELTVYTVKMGEEDISLFAFRTKEDLLKQAEFFAQNTNNYPFEWLRPIATGFWKQADAIGLDELPELVCKYAGQFFPDTSMFVPELTRRMNKIAGQHRPAYALVIEKCSAAVSADEYYQLCGEAVAVEKQAGAYDSTVTSRQLGNIIDNTFTLSLDKIAQLLDVVEMGGETYGMTDLQKISKEVYKQAFEFDLDPKNAEQLREVLPTMPASDISLFRELSGVCPL